MQRSLWTGVLTAACLLAAPNLMASEAAHAKGGTTTASVSKSKVRDKANRTGKTSKTTKAPRRAKSGKHRQPQHPVVGKQPKTGLPGGPIINGRI